MDNFKIDITSEGTVDLDLALRLALSRGNEERVRVALRYKELRLKPDEYGSRIDPAGVRTLVLIRDSAEGGELITQNRSLLPFELDVRQIRIFVTEWLAKIPDTDYAQYSDHDGSVGYGWRLFTDFYGHVAGHHYAVCGIQPIWAWYGK